VTLTLDTVLTAARDKSPWFHISRITNAILARHLSDVQNELIGAALRRDAQYLAQTANVMVALSDDSAPGTAGAGTVGGVPGSLDDSGGFATLQATAGALIEASTSAAGGATVWVSERVCSAATATTIQSTGAARSVDEDADGSRVVVITSGVGLGQIREIASNTADTWTVADAWETTPDDSSIFDIVTPEYGADNAAGVVTGLPATSTTQGYLVKLNAQGVPYIDFTTPLVATMDVGVPLPAMQFPIDATVWYTDGTSAECHIVSRHERFGRAPAILVDSQQVFLVGEDGDWSDVQSVALRYAPVAPAFTALTDVFLLPDHARPVLIAKAEAFMALRVLGMADVSMTPTQLAAHVANSATAERNFLNNVTHAKRGRFARVRDRW
jgi:hypothetical protein